MHTQPRTPPRTRAHQASILQMEPPDLYVRQNPVPNAYTLAITGRKPFIVVHTSLLELLSPRELQAVLAHGAPRLARGKGGGALGGWVGGWVGGA
jgi:hypothetical protein